MSTEEGYKSARQEDNQSTTISKDDKTGESKETSRIEAFSDGVFAIAITLLVLDLHWPPTAASGTSEHLTQSEFWKQLGSLGPQYLGFFISFAFIGVMWINHHRLFNLIARTDNNLLLLNLLLLLGVTVLPFPTQVLADNLTNPETNHAAALIYAGLFFVIAVFFNLLWRYAAGNNRLLDRNAERKSVERITRQYALGPLIYLFISAVSFFSVELCMALVTIVAGFFALPPPPLEMITPSPISPTTK